MSSFIVTGETKYASHTILTLPGISRNQLGRSLIKCPFEVLLGNYLDHCVDEILIVDPHIKTDCQQHLLLLLLKFIKEKCRRNLKEKRKLFITLYTGAKHIGSLDRTEFWPDGPVSRINPKAVYHNIKEAVGFDSEVKFTPVLGTWHDRSICIYRRSKATFTHIQMGKGISFMKANCRCFASGNFSRNWRQQNYNNEFVFDRESNTWVLGIGRYLRHHYTACVKPLTTKEYGLDRAECSVHMWDDKTGNVLKAFKDCIEYGDVGGFRDLKLFQVEQVSAP